MQLIQIYSRGMAYCGLLFTLLISIPSFCVGNAGPPVFFFKDARVQSSIPKQLAGHAMPTDEFSSLLSSIKRPDIMVTFLQDELSSEDFLRLDQHMKRGGLFKNVQKYSEMKTSTYFPMVKSPEHSLSLLRNNYDEQVELKDASQALQYLEKTKLQKDTSILIYLVPTAVEESSTAIKKNDDIVGDVMSLVEQSGLTYTAFFTGKHFRKAHESVVVQGVGRHLLQSDAEANTTKFFYNSTNCLVYVDEMKINGELIIKKPTDFSCTSDKKTNGTTTVKIDKLQMVYAKQPEYGMWQLKSASVDGHENLTLPDVSAPMEFSYHCSTSVKFKSNNGTVVLAEFKTIQIQMFEFKAAGKFGYAYDCTGFFTIPLWTGLLTALFLISVTIYGIYMLSNIQTFDQYDDPKSKPLVVNVSE